jgi:hypothetical protein
MHPDERPPRIEALRQSLFGIENTRKDPTTDLLPPPTWSEILHKNRMLIGTTAFLFIVATVISVFEF